VREKMTTQQGVQRDITYLCPCGRKRRAKEPGAGRKTITRTCACGLKARINFNKLVTADVKGYSPISCEVSKAKGGRKQ